MSEKTQQAVREFFGARAAGWEDRFPGDQPRYDAATGVLGLRPGDRVLDAGCGTGRALAPLRERVGPGGTVLGVDLTPEMLAEAAAKGRKRYGPLVLADVARLPLRDGACDAVFGAGLVSHLPGPGTGLRELARVTRPAGRLALFHPLGRAALAARHGRELSEDDVRARARLAPLLAATGWRLVSYVDEDARFLAVAVREPERPTA
ncbi:MULTISPECIES: methyltransferase domain-containing protein [unclassified Streptomyces]|uniref:class I SAM-dependent methyltransferase n=1 Tax=unclassified Streptomyces TaxID=2593676 RepID=UPI00081E1B8B|nr:MULTISPECIES: methyltransferase domain-containing protein [unclassified Streptomyces]MYR26335.1 methyltransferase domain-containing protein [Streptomyces sp. SID4945]SCF00714.1 Methyltransferase domain-containing protein [Streptomyces sp. LcepLS]